MTDIFDLKLNIYKKNESERTTQKRNIGKVCCCFLRGFELNEEKETRYTVELEIVKFAFFPQDMTQFSPNAIIYVL